MPRWLGRLVWCFRGKRNVRLHLEVMPGTPVATLEGLLVGRWGGHYVLLVPKIVGEGGVSPVDGTVEVPAGRVVFVQVLPS